MFFSVGMQDAVDFVRDGLVCKHHIFGLDIQVHDTKA